MQWLQFYVICARPLSDGQKSKLSHILRIKSWAIQNVLRLSYWKRFPYRPGGKSLTIWYACTAIQELRQHVQGTVFPHPLFFFNFYEPWGLRCTCFWSIKGFFSPPKCQYKLSTNPYLFYQIGKIVYRRQWANLLSSKRRTFLDL